MMDAIARLEIADADPALYDVLLGPGHRAGVLSVVAAERSRAAFGAQDLERTRSRLQRRGIELTDDGFVVNGLRFGLVATPDPVTDADVELDHMVIHVADAERAIASYGGRLGLDLRLERHAPQWGMHMMFFRAGEAILEVVEPLGNEMAGERAHEGSDELWGVTWRVRDLDETTARLRDARIDISEIRQGRKRGTRVCTVRDRRAGLRTLLIQQESLPFSRS